MTPSDRRGGARLRATPLVPYAAIAAVLVAGVALPSSAMPAPAETLTGIIGTDSRIVLRRSNGGIVSTLRPGPYVIVVRDRSRRHNFHLYGPTNPARPTANRRTGIRYMGTMRWAVQLASGSYIYSSDRGSTQPRTFIVR